MSTTFVQKVVGIFIFQLLPYNIPQTVYVPSRKVTAPLLLDSGNLFPLVLWISAAISPGSLQGLYNSPIPLQIVQWYAGKWEEGKSPNL